MSLACILVPLPSSGLVCRYFVYPLCLIDLSHSFQSWIWNLSVHLRHAWWSGEAGMLLYVDDLSFESLVPHFCRVVLLFSIPSPSSPCGLIACLFSVLDSSRDSLLSSCLRRLGTLSMSGFLVFFFFWRSVSCVFGFEYVSRSCIRHNI